MISDLCSITAKPLYTATLGAGLPTHTHMAGSILLHQAVCSEAQLIYCVCVSITVLPTNEATGRTE